MKHPEGMRKELLQDFKKAMEKIDHTSYSPTSPEVMNAVFTGILWYLVQETEEHDYEMFKDTKDEIKDELKSAEEYWEKYVETKDSVYKQMTADELRHADYLLRQAKMKVLDPKEQAKLHTYTEWHKQIASRMQGM